MSFIVTSVFNVSVNAVAGRILVVRSVRATAAVLWTSVTLTVREF